MDLIRFFQITQKLKDIKRTGWLYKDIENPESVGDHTYGVALLALLVPLPKGLDRDRLIRMALVHDIAETEVGDIVWETGTYSNKDKQARKHLSEVKTVNKIFGIIEDEDTKSLVLEFIMQKSAAAKFLRELSKLEMVFQALEYEKKVQPSKLDEFWENAEKYIKSEELLPIFTTLKSKRATSRAS